MRENKNQLRRKATLLRDAQPQLSHRVIARLLTLPEIQEARSILVYVSSRSEVRTHELIEGLLSDGKQVFVPFCDRDELGLFRLMSLQELVVGTFGILEPSSTDRLDQKRLAHIDRIAVAIVPGLAFDRNGNRLGYGKGYFDKLLARATTTRKIALAFECQLVDSLPHDRTDVAMEMIVTEQHVYRCQNDGPNVS